MNVDLNCLMKYVDFSFWSYEYFVVFIVFVIVVELNCVEYKCSVDWKVWGMVWFYVSVESYWLFCDVRCRWIYDIKKVYIDLLKIFIFNKLIVLYIKSINLYVLFVKGM